jgi:Holliday junction resolvase
MVMGGKASRRKGAGFERDLAKRWRDNGLFPEAKRGLMQSRCAREAPDVEGTPYWVEAKCGKKPRLYAAFDQAAAATDGRPLLVVAKRDRRETVVVMRLEDFEALVSNYL